MLTMQNARYLSKTWHEEKQRAMKDGHVSGIYTQDELELTDSQMGGVYIDNTYKVKTTPIDSETSSSEYDMRDMPEVSN